MKTLICMAALLLTTFVAHAKLNVVATLPDYAAIAKEVGGDKIDVTSLAKGPEDAHFVEAKPSFIRVLNKADVLLEGGAELEIGWLPPLVENARNSKILPGAPGRVALSTGVKLLGVADGPVDRSMGDVHPLGNPHYALDPENGARIADQIAKVLSGSDPNNAPQYLTNLTRFKEKLKTKTAQWNETLKPFRGTKVITYHRSYDYLLEHFGLVLAGTIEPRPGLEPSPTHINSLISKTKGSGVKLVIVEPFRPRKTPDYLAKEIGAKVLVLPEKVSALGSVPDYFSLFDYNVAQIANALK